MDEIDTNAKLDDERLFHKSDMLIVMVHELIMPRKKHSNGKPYVNLPKGIRKLLANATNNVTKDWKDKNEDERMNWWNMKYGNLRYTMGFPGLSGGGELAERRLNAAREHFESNGQESVKIGLELLQKLHRQETHQLLIEMGLSLDDWIPHINEHGEEPLDGSNEMSEPTEDPLLDRLASEELDSLERRILDEMRKTSKRLGGPFSKTRYDGGNNDDIPRLKIWSGIPGTGKSYQLQEYVQSIVQDEAKDVFRTVFHPEYSMYDFVGQIRPKQSSTDESRITYPFEPGPFTRALRRAKSVNDAKLDNRVFLIIEELNRGNAAAIFGEIFQLLDFRDDGESQYGIVQKDIASLLGLPEDSEIKLPRNIYIYATMNISDQNVYSLDTAFLRRWDREYVYADTWEGACTTWKIKLPNNKSIMWQEFAETVNNWLIINANEIGINHPEDKRLGPWFVDERTCNDPLLFANKLFTYLWTNVFSFGTAREKVFSSETNTLDSLLKRYVKDGLRVFSDDLFSLFSQKTTETTAHSGTTTDLGDTIQNDGATTASPSDGEPSEKTPAESPQQGEDGETRESSSDGEPSEKTLAGPPEEVDDAEPSSENSKEDPLDEIRQNDDDGLPS